MCPFNRTNLELKLFLRSVNNASEFPFNRTNLELKLCLVLSITLLISAFNRTNLELKLTIESIEDCECVELLIAPIWN